MVESLWTHVERLFRQRMDVLMPPTNEPKRRKEGTLSRSIHNAFLSFRTARIYANKTARKTFHHVVRGGPRRLKREMGHGTARVDERWLRSGKARNRKRIRV
ncbi:hypothetical protein FRC18_003384 [Serendipita sp. 400]|nr:hypothetical protein FRC18_003384 [Serendipita sp. 400]